MTYKVEVLVGFVVVDVREFDDENKAIDFASEKQDEGFKVRITP